MVGSVQVTTTFGLLSGLLIAVVGADGVEGLDAARIDTVEESAP